MAIAGGAGGRATMGGAERGCGTILRGSGRAGRGAAGAAAAGTAGAAAAGTRGAAGAVDAVGLAGGAATGFAGKRACRASSSSFFLARMAFITSPGLEMCERSILGTMVCPAWRVATALAGAAGLASCIKCARIFSASSASTELECVLTPDTPRPGRMSIIARGLTSNSRARSLIRTLLIRLFSKECCQTALSRS